MDELGKIYGWIDGDRKEWRWMRSRKERIMNGWVNRGKERIATNR